MTTDRNREEFDGDALKASVHPLLQRVAYDPNGHGYYPDLLAELLKRYENAPPGKLFSDISGHTYRETLPLLGDEQKE